MMNLIFTGLKNGVVPYGTELIFPPTPSAQALGYNTSPPLGLFALQVPHKIEFPHLQLAVGFTMFNVQEELPCRFVFPVVIFLPTWVLPLQQRLSHQFPLTQHRVR